MRRASIPDVEWSLLEIIGALAAIALAASVAAFLLQTFFGHLPVLVLIGHACCIRRCWLRIVYAAPAVRT